MPMAKLTTDQSFRSQRPIVLVLFPQHFSSSQVLYEMPNDWSSCQTATQRLLSNGTDELTAFKLYRTVANITTWSTLTVLGLSRWTSPMFSDPNSTDGLGVAVTPDTYSASRTQPRSNTYSAVEPAAAAANLFSALSPHRLHPRVKSCSVGIH